jgi:hypothetical protein
MPGLEFNFQERFYDRIEVGVHIKAHYKNSDGEDAVSPRTDAVMTIDYVPEYWIKEVYCDSLDYVKIKYEYSEKWLRSDDRFCVESMKIVDENGENGVEIAASKPWGTVAISDEEGSDGYKVAVATIPTSSLSDFPIGEALSVHLRFNPSYGASGAEFAETVLAYVKCNGGGAANTPITMMRDHNGFLEIHVEDNNQGIKTITHCFVKLRGSDKAYDQKIIPVNEWTPFLHVPRGVKLTFAVVGIAYDENGKQLLSVVRKPQITQVKPSAPVEVVSLRDPSARAMARYDLTISDDFVPAMETFKLSGRDRETVCYGEGGSSAWSLSANLVKGVADAYDTEEAWRKVAASGDCVLLLSDGTRRVVSIGDLRFNRSHPSFTGISATLREVDA